MDSRLPPDVGGYVLAGGKSSRMGRDKALLELAGRPLALHAVVKLRRVCAEVHILSSRPELEGFAPLVRDLHPGCGPLGGMEAALEHSRHEWNLLMPVDMPFLPAALLDWWVRMVVGEERRGVRVAMFTVDGRPQSALCLLHREVAPFVRGAMERGEFKLFPVLEEAGRELAARQGVSLDRVFLNLPWGEGESEAGWMPTEAQLSARHLWFANLNTPEEFAAAEAFTGALDTE
jgi:molybdopterin-guanine dinucleotide biosynthesis protein A